MGMYLPAGVRQIWPDWEDEEAEVWGEPKWYLKNEKFDMSDFICFVAVFLFCRSTSYLTESNMLRNCESICWYLPPPTPQERKSRALLKAILHWLCKHITYRLATVIHTKFQTESSEWFTAECTHLRYEHRVMGQRKKYISPISQTWWSFCVDFNFSSS